MLRQTQKQKRVSARNVPTLFSVFGLTENPEIFLKAPLSKRFLHYFKLQ